MKGRRSLEIKPPWWPYACKINILIIIKTKLLSFIKKAGGKLAEGNKNKPQKAANATPDMKLN